MNFTDSFACQVEDSLLLKNVECSSRDSLKILENAHEVLWGTDKFKNASSRNTKGKSDRKIALTYCDDSELTTIRGRHFDICDCVIRSGCLNTLVWRSACLLQDFPGGLIGALEKQNVLFPFQTSQGDLETGSFEYSCLTYLLLIGCQCKKGLPQVVSPLKRTSLALQSSYVFFHHLYPVDVKSEIVPERMILFDSASNWLLQRKAEQLCAYGASFMPLVLKNQPEKLDTPHGVPYMPIDFCRLLLRLLALGKTSYALSISVVKEPKNCHDCVKEEIFSPSHEKNITKGRTDLKHVHLLSLESNHEENHILFKCFEKMTEHYRWSAQVDIFISMLTRLPHLPDAAVAAVLIVFKRRWCFQVQTYEESKNVSIEESQSQISCTEITGNMSAKSDLRSLNCSILSRLVKEVLDWEEMVTDGYDRLTCLLNWFKLCITAYFNDSCEKIENQAIFRPYGEFLIRKSGSRLSSILKHLSEKIDIERKMLETPYVQSHPGTIGTIIGELPTTNVILKGENREMTLYDAQLNRLALTGFAIADVRKLLDRMNQFS